MRTINLGCLILLALSACAAPEKLTTEQWRERLLVGKVNGKDLYAASQFNRSVFEGLEEATKRNAYALSQTCPNGHKVKEIRTSDPYLQRIPGGFLTTRVRTVETVFTCS